MWLCGSPECSRSDPGQSARHLTLDLAGRRTVPLGGRERQTPGRVRGGREGPNCREGFSVRVLPDPVSQGHLDTGRECET